MAVEDSLFQYEGHDSIAEMHFVYYNVIRYSDGKRFDTADINFDTGILTYQNENGERETFGVYLTCEKRS